VSYSGTSGRVYGAVTQKIGRLNWPIKARCFWTKSETSPWNFNPSSCAFLQDGESSAWEARDKESRHSAGSCDHRDLDRMIEDRQFEATFTTG